MNCIVITIDGAWAKWMEGVLIDLYYCVGGEVHGVGTISFFFVTFLYFVVSRSQSL